MKSLLQLVQRLFGGERQTPLVMRENPEYAFAEIGAWTYGRPKVQRFDRTTRLRIGAFTSIADGVRILLGGEHRPDWVSTYPLHVFVPGVAPVAGHPTSKGDIVIGNDVWICAGATILSGVTIGNGAVIGAGSVISRDVPPYSVAAGNPARIVKARFDAATAEALERTQWWHWPETRIREAAPLILSNRIPEFLAFANAAATEATTR